MESKQYRVKIKLPDGAIKTIERNIEQTKRLKADVDYIDVGWKVLGVPYWGPIYKRDLDGEAFHPKTDIWLKPGDEVNITYYHGFGADSPDEWQEIPVIIGRAKYVGSDKRGHWFEPLLDPEEPLAQRLITAGADNVKASSGAVSHLVRNGKGGLIDVWPVGELALFDVNEWRLPANDYAVVEAKSADIPESIAKDSDVKSIEVNVSDEALQVIEIKSNKHKESIMDEKEKDEEVKQEEQVSQVDVKAELEAFKKSFMEELKESLKAEKGEPKGAPTVMKTANLGDPDPIQDFNRWLLTGEGKIKKHSSIVEIPNGRGGKVKAALQEGTTTEGGYLVPAAYLGRIIEKRSETDLLTQLGVQTFSTDSYQFYFPTEGTSMTKFSIVAEEGAISAAENEPTFSSAGTPPVTLYKFMKLIKISSELEEDNNSGLDMSLVNMIGRAWAATNNYYVQVGSGSSQPEGVFVGGTAALTLDSASAIGASEIPELIGKLKIPYRDRAVMLMNRTTAAYLSGLTGNQFVFRQPPVSQAWAGGEDLGIGYPVIPTEDTAAIGASAKSLLFGNFEFYGWVTNRSLEVRRLTELYAGNDQIGIRCKFRAGGAVLQSEAFQYATHPTA